jgi:hypothetical protein
MAKQTPNKPTSQQTNINGPARKTKDTSQQTSDQTLT